MEEARSRFKLAENALKGAERVGGLTVIPGGQSEPTIGKVVKF